MDNVTTLPVRKPEAEVAAELKVRMQTTLSALVDIYNDARKAGLECAFQINQAEPNAPYVLLRYDVIKRF